QTLSGDYSYEISSLRTNFLEKEGLENHYYKSLVWLWEDSACGEKIVHGWLYALATYLAQSCSPDYPVDEHGNRLDQDQLRQFFDNLTETPGYGQELALLGGGWATDIPVDCEDACQSTMVEYLVMDHWCNWNKGVSTLE